MKHPHQHPLSPSKAKSQSFPKKMSIGMARNGSCIGWSFKVILGLLMLSSCGTNEVGDSSEGAKDSRNIGTPWTFVDSPTVDMPTRLPICDSLDSQTMIVVVSRDEEFECTNITLGRRSLIGVKQLMEFLSRLGGKKEIERLCFMAKPTSKLLDWGNIISKVRNLGIEDVILTQIDE